jgi:hypothetical protein
MSIGDQDHGRVAMPVAAILASAVHQPLDLALGEVAPLDCQVYDAWAFALAPSARRGRAVPLPQLRPATISLAQAAFGRCRIPPGRTFGF